METKPDRFPGIHGNERREQLKTAHDRLRSLMDRIMIPQGIAEVMDLLCGKQPPRLSLSFLPRTFPRMERKEHHRKLPAVRTCRKADEPSLLDMYPAGCLRPAFFPEDLCHHHPLPCVFPYAAEHSHLFFHTASEKSCDSLGHHSFYIIQNNRETLIQLQPVFLISLDQCLSILCHQERGEDDLGQITGQEGEHAHHHR